MWLRQSGLFALERNLCIVVSGLAPRFLGLRLFEPSLRFAACPAGAVELRLGLAQRAGRKPGLTQGSSAPPAKTFQPGGLFHLPT